MFISKYIENNHPAFLIIPFQTDDIYNNYQINKKHEVNLKDKLEKRYPGKYVTITNSGRKALGLVIKHIIDHGQQTVRIQTTSDNFYISSCVTETIEKHTHWHRSPNSAHDILLVNHEFGYADNRLWDMDKSLLIEDCAFAFASKFENGKRCGALAPFSIFSFSKFFPIQIGGFLLSDTSMENKEDSNVERYISNVVGYYFNKIDHWVEKRQTIFKYYNEVFGQLNCKSYFPFSLTDVPGVYLFRLPEGVDAQKLKEYYIKRGIQCSVFYKEQAFYLPLNQFTLKWHVELFAELFNNFINKENE